MFNTRRYVGMPTRPMCPGGRVWVLSLILVSGRTSTASTPCRSAVFQRALAVLTV
uniref:Uncharacterized protein n=1 Tax=Anguilla anguilla TaxID=7936 RepID=A0A0E9Q7T4_ANGAN